MPGLRPYKYSEARNKEGLYWYESNPVSSSHIFRCFFGQFNEPLIFKLKKPVSAFRDNKGGVCFEGAYAVYLQYCIGPLPLPHLYPEFVPSGDVFKTKNICNNFFSSYIPCRYMTVATRLLTINTLKYSYPPCKDVPCP